MEKMSLNCITTHPSMDPEIFTDRLKLTPFLSQKLGDKRVTPTGIELGGRYRSSKWSYIIDIEPGGSLESELDSLINYFYKHKDFFVEFKEDGGKTSVFYRLGNIEHRAFEMPPGVTLKLAEMKIVFGFEIFANQNV